MTHFSELDTNKMAVISPPDCNCSHDIAEAATNLTVVLPTLESAILINPNVFKEGLGFRVTNKGITLTVEQADTNLNHQTTLIRTVAPGIDIPTIALQYGNSDTPKIFLWLKEYCIELHDPVLWEQISLRKALELAQTFAQKASEWLLKSGYHQDSDRVKYLSDLNDALQRTILPPIARI